MLRSGRRRRTARLDLVWRDNAEGHPRLGVIVPRHGETVVARNRLRRRLREHARRHVLPALPPIDLVIRCRPPAYAAPPRSLRTDLDEWLNSFTP